MLGPWKKSYDQHRQHIIKQRHYFAYKGLSSQSYGFSSSHVWMWELDYKESWAPKNWCFWTMVLEKTLESPMKYKEIQPVYLKGNRSWIFIGRTDAEAETPILWPPDVKSQLIRKHSAAGKEWRQKEKGTTNDEMIGWHQQLNGHEFEQAPGDGEGQESLACCSWWGCKEFQTEWLKNNKRQSPDNNLGSQVLVLGQEGGRKTGNISLEVVTRCYMKLEELKTCKGWQFVLGDRI